MAGNGIVPDMSKMPAIVAMGPVVYNTKEIEHQLYMFDHRMVGCISLVVTKDMDEARGQIVIEGQEVTGWFFITREMPTYGTIRFLAVPVRGIVSVPGESYQMKLAGFAQKDGTSVPDLDFTIDAAPAMVEDPRYQEHDSIACQAACEGMVLLRNEDQVLPLAAGSKLNLLGEGVTNFRTSATGAGRINPRFTRDLREAIADCSDFVINEELDTYYKRPVNTLPPAEVLKTAARENDTAIIIISRGTGENVDNRPVQGDYYLTDEEEKLISSVTDTFANVIAVLNTGYPIDMRWTKNDKIKGIIYTGLAGQAGAQALVEILSGKVNPSGKLADTWAWDYHDIPASVNFYNPTIDEAPILADDGKWVDTCYEEGIYVGYRYFDTFRKDYAYAFGFGMSYTDFTLEALEMSYENAEAGRDILVKCVVKVTNTGNVAGKEVVQLYVSKPDSIQEMPVKELAAFAKTRLLAPGESEEVTLTVAKKLLATYVEADSAWILSTGSYEFLVGNSSDQLTACGELLVEEAEVLQSITYHMPTPVDFTEISPKGAKAWPEGTLSKVREDADGLSYSTPRPIDSIQALPEYHGEPITYAMLKDDPSLLDDFVAQMTDEELCRLNVMYGSGWGMDQKGEAGRRAPLERLALPDYICADGNNGVNLKKPNIGMPTSVVVCQTFNTQLAREVGRVIGEEAVENDIQMILATALNIHRNPLNGRHAEYFSEDPVLAGTMAAYQVQGMHAAGISDSVKHVACNNAETARKSNHTLVHERALREIYLRAFELLIDIEKPDTIMTGYNAINGSMCGSDNTMISHIFREELGFDGFAMTDWNSYDTVAYTDAVNAGICWLTPGENDGSITGKLVDAVKAGTVTRGILERNQKQVIATMLKQGI